MIRLSRYTAVEILPTISVKDINSTFLHLYQFTNNNRTQSQFVQGDTQTINSREFAYSPYIQNISLNPTPAFYPDEQISADFHTNSNLQVVLNDLSLPAFQFQNANLYFSQGFGYDSNNKGTLIRAYVKLSNSKEVTLAAIWDKPAASNITASTQKLFESQIFNAKLFFQIPDIDFILNSTDAKIIELKQLVFGNDVPDTIYFEYSSLTDANIDTIMIDTYTYDQLNAAIYNTGRVNTTMQNASDIFAKLQFNERYILSSLENAKYDVETYLNKFKTSEQTYSVIHTFSTNFYDDTSTLIGSESIQIQNPTNIFDAIKYVPIAPETSDHFETSVSISILNDQTGMRITKTSSIVITDNVNKFKVSFGAVILNVQTDKVYNKINQQINQIVQKTDTPDIIQITKPIYVQVEKELDTLTVLSSTFTATIKTDIDLSNVSKTYLRIDNIIVQNTADLMTFAIPAKAYYVQVENYFLLNQFQEVIASGKIVKK